MKPTDKRFWMWIVIIALMPVMMGVFTGCALVDAFAELFNYRNIELFYYGKSPTWWEDYSLIANCKV